MSSLLCQMSRVCSGLLAAVQAHPEIWELLLHNEFNYPVAAQFAHFLNFIKYMNMHRHETKRKKSLFGTFHTHTSMFRHKIITFIMSSFSIHGFFCMLFQYWRLDNKVDNLRNWKQGLGVAVFCLDFLLGAVFLVLFWSLWFCCLFGLVCVKIQVFKAQL